MSLEKYYEVLGLRPDASEQEVKSAYRDLAKVWHPDRFAHDPRLQQKAQDKLKEINEAYEEINSPASGRRRARRPAPPPPSATTSAPRTPRGHADFANVVARRNTASGGLSRLVPVALAVIALFVAFFVSYRFLKPNAAAPAGSGRPQAAAQTAVEQRAEESTDAAAERTGRKAAGKQQRAGGAAAADGGAGDTPSGARETSPDYKALPTVNRTIDPTTGLLATRACPLKALRTFASGQEPQKSCDADHSRKSANAPAPATAAPPATQAAAQPAAQSAAVPATKNKSRLKSVLGAVASPGKWFRKKQAPRGETRADAGQ